MLEWQFKRLSTSRLPCQSEKVYNNYEVMISPNHRTSELVQCASFKTLGEVQPFQVVVSSNVLLLMVRMLFIGVY